MADRGSRGGKGGNRGGRGKAQGGRGGGGSAQPAVATLQDAKQASAYVDIPRDMFDWAVAETGQKFSDSIYTQFTANAAKRGTAGITAVQLVVLREGKAQFVVTAPTPYIARSACGMLEFRLQQEIALHEQRRLKERLASEVASVEAEIQEGRRAEFTVPREALGLIIGKGGANLTRMEAMEGVDRIVVEKDTCVVRIKGTPEGVAAAQEELQFVVARIPITGAQVAFVVGTGGSTIRDIKARSRVMQIDIVPRGGPLPRPGDAPHRSSKSTDELDIAILGRQTSVDTACMMYEAHMDSARAAADLEAEVSALSAQLDALDVAYGDAPAPAYGRGGGRSRGGGRAGGSPSRPPPAQGRGASAAPAPARGGAGRSRGGGAAGRSPTRPAQGGKGTGGGAAKAQGGKGTSAAPAAAAPAAAATAGGQGGGQRQRRRRNRKKGGGGGDSTAAAQ